MTHHPTTSKQLGLLWRKASVFIAGFTLTILGITLVLRQWEAVVLVFKAFIGPFLAVMGLVILFSATLKSYD